MGPHNARVDRDLPSQVEVEVLVVAIELVTLAWLRWRFFDTSFARSFASVTLGGLVIAGVSAALGSV